jgi:polyisoprenoid-binding protein YceI
MSRLATWIGIGLLTASSLAVKNPARTQKQEIDVQESTLTVRVGKSGLFSPFGHTHEISAPISEGLVSTTAPASVTIRVDSRNMRVMDEDEDVDASVREEIQKTMLGPQVLESERYPEILFRSTAVSADGVDRWVVRGNLTIHGQSRPVDVNVTRSEGHYRGSATVKQTDFGIEPIRAAGGAVKVQNEVRIEFDIRVAQ